MANPEHVRILRSQASAWANWKAENRRTGLWGPYGAGLDYDHVMNNVLTWNVWKRDNADVVPDLSGAMLQGLDLSESDMCGVNLNKASLARTNLTGSYFNDANLSETDLAEAKFLGGSFERTNFTEARFGERLLEGNTFGGAHLANMNFAGATFAKAYLFAADFYGADLTGTDFRKATLTHANFSTAKMHDANLSKAHMSGANFAWTDLSNANLTQASLMACNLMEANLTNADISGCFVYGVAAWNVNLSGSNQSNLIITRKNNSTITVDNLEVAQFVYLLLDNSRVRDLIEMIGKKAVLILGNFRPERKAVLEAIREVLRESGYLPILFDFDVPLNRDTTETVSILAHLSRFIIADITDARSIPQELQAIVPNLPSVPVKPLLLSSQRQYGMFDHLQRYPQVLEIHFYNDIPDLLSSLKAKVIGPAEAKALALTAS